MSKKLTLVNCLGWCRGKFKSTDKCRERFCPKCRKKREGLETRRCEVPMVVKFEMVRDVSSD